APTHEHLEHRRRAISTLSAGVCEIGDLVTHPSGGRGVHDAPPSSADSLRTCSSVSGGAVAAIRATAASTVSNVCDGCVGTARASRSERKTLTRPPILTAGSLPCLIQPRRV